VAYTAYVDLSAKIEQWPKNSAVAMSNGVSKAYLVTGEIKQRARALLTTLHGRKTVRYRLLAALVYLAVKEDLRDIRQIVIDKDYGGTDAEATIKNVLLRLLRSDKPDTPAGFVRFDNVKGSQADELARQVYNGKKKPTRIVIWAEMESILRQ